MEAAREFAFADLRRIEVVRSRDGDGDPMFQLTRPPFAGFGEA